ncbi:class F sortase [Candidatus Beckwithbacteria bacterium]|nr:class F sortase [Candidatus Beckwithbacteria bacterium]
MFSSIKKIGLFSWKQILLINVILIVIILTVYGFIFNSEVGRYNSKTVKLAQNPVASPTPTPTPKPTPIPTRIIIPKINVDTQVVQVGFDAETEEMEVPEDASQVGWYMFGDAPGKLGSSVFSGHLDVPGGAPAVFYNLRNLQIGDTFEVYNDQNEVLIYKVIEATDYPLDNFPKEKIYGERDISQVALVTCSGYWNPAAQLYSHRRVVIGQLNALNQLAAVSVREAKSEQYWQEPFAEAIYPRVEEAIGPYLRSEVIDGMMTIFLASDGQDFQAIQFDLLAQNTLSKQDIIISQSFDSCEIEEKSNGLRVTLFDVNQDENDQSFNSQNNEVKIAALPVSIGFIKIENVLVWVKSKESKTLTTTYISAINQGE